MSIEKLRIIALTVLARNRWIVALIASFPLIAGLRERNEILVSYRSWSFLFFFSILISGAYFSVLFVVAVFQNIADAKREQAGNVMFSGAIGWRLLLGTSLIGVVVLGIGSYHQRGRLTAVDVIFPIVMGLLDFYCWPRTITFSAGALVQPKIFGGLNSIPYSEALAARFDPRQQCVIVSSKTGGRIVHSMFHAGRKQFARQLAQLTGADVQGFPT